MFWFHFFFFLTCSCTGAISKEWLLCVYWKLVGKAKEKLDQGICAVVYICFGWEETGRVVGVQRIRWQVMGASGQWVLERQLHGDRDIRGWYSHSLESPGCQAERLGWQFGAAELSRWDSLGVPHLKVGASALVHRTGLPRGSVTDLGRSTSSQKLTLAPSGPHPELEQEPVVSGASDLWGRGCVLHPEPVGQPGLCAEGPVPGGDAGELCKRGFPG